MVLALGLERTRRVAYGVTAAARGLALTRRGRHGRGLLRLRGELEGLDADFAWMRGLLGRCSTSVSPLLRLGKKTSSNRLNICRCAISGRSREAISLTWRWRSRPPRRC